MLIDTLLTKDNKCGQQCKYKKSDIGNFAQNTMNAANNQKYNSNTQKRVKSFQISHSGLLFPRFSLQHLITLHLLVQFDF